MEEIYYENCNIKYKVKNIIIFLISAIIGFLFSLFLLNKINIDNNIEKINIEKVKIIENSDVSTIVENVMPAMVSITSIHKVNFLDIYSLDQTIYSSGIIIGNNNHELLILTNKNSTFNSNKIFITFNDDTSIEGNIKSIDAKLNLSIISVNINELEKNTIKNIKIAILGNSNDLELGEKLIVIGNTLGYGQTVTTGIVSAINRKIECNDGITRNYIQTDAAINPGNAGGPLLNMKGEVIGINEHEINFNSIKGINFAIPISDINNNINNLISRETKKDIPKSTQGKLGINCVNVTKDINERYNIPLGIYISQIEEGSAAYNSNLKVGDIIIGINDMNIYTINDLINILNKYRIGETIKIKYMHFENGNYKENEIDIKLK